MVDGCEATIFARTRNCDVRLTIAFFAAIPFFTMRSLDNANLRSPARNSQSKQLLAALAGTFPDRTWANQLEIVCEFSVAPACDVSIVRLHCVYI